MTLFRRSLLLSLFAPMVPARIAAQDKKGLLVRAARPENFEAPLDALGQQWITPIERFFVRSHHGVVRLDAASWKLEVAGQVERPLSFSLDDLRKLPRAELTGVLECAGNGRAFYQPHVPGVQWQGGAVGNARWAGVRLAEVLKQAGVKPAAREVLFEPADVPAGTMPKFQRTLPVDKALDPNTLLAYEMNGQPLPAEHGFPLRVIAPGWAGDSWVKWLRRIELLDREFEGFFMATAYRMPVLPVAPGTAVDPKDMRPLTALRVKSVIASPPDGFWLAPAPVRVRGAAWSGESPVTGVEVSTDTGRTWRPATLGADQEPFAWRLWEFLWKPEREGHHVLMARATDASGDVQPLAQEWNPSGYLWSVAPRAGVTISSKPVDLAAIRGRVTYRLMAGPPPALKTACLPCHGTDIIEQQRLTRTQWEREIDKMIRWGARVRPADREAILNYLLQFGP